MKPLITLALTLSVLAPALCAETIIGQHQEAAVGSVAAYPTGNALSGPCCEDDTSYCESLWANYCQEKKSHCDTLSPRRSVCGHGACLGGCGGFPFQGSCCPPTLCLPSFKSFRWHHAKVTHCTGGSCAAVDGGCSDECAANASDLTVAPLPEEAIGSGAMPPPMPSEEATPMQPEPVDEAEVPDPPPVPEPPAPDDSARRWRFPFSWRN